MSHALKPKKKPTGDYPIGYCKPPESAKWPPGKSANPSGRPPKIPTWEELVIGEACKPAKAIKGGKEVNGTILEFFLQSGFQKSMEGKTGYFKIMMSVVEAAIEKVTKKAEEQEKATPIDWTEEHEKLFQEFQAAANSKDDAKPNTPSTAPDGTPT
jgi:Family of unknown function (DUF5681)